MRLWTIQTYNVFETIKKTGIYRCNPDLSSLLEMEEFVNAYKWISKEMKKRIGNPPNNVTFPVWAWYNIDGKNLRPDMRKSDMRVFQKSVLMELEIPDNQVLLSDFDLWHVVLNDTFCYKTSIEGLSYEEWDAETDKEDLYYSSLSDKEKVAYKEKSWENVICSNFNKLPAFVQATFWELKKENIKKIWVLKGFKRK